MVKRLQLLIAREYPNVAQSTAFERIASQTGLSLSTMQRVMSGTTGPSIDTLSDLARHLGSTVAEILEPSPFQENEVGTEKSVRAKSSRIPTY